jgi:hypothetical protein
MLDCRSCEKQGAVSVVKPNSWLQQNHGSSTPSSSSSSYSWHLPTTPDSFSGQQRSSLSCSMIDGPAYNTTRTNMETPKVGGRDNVTLSDAYMHASSWVTGQWLQLDEMTRGAAVINRSDSEEWLRTSLAPHAVFMALPLP